jgi:hypothetical protein
MVIVLVGSCGLAIGSKVWYGFRPANMWAWPLLGVAWVHWLVVLVIVWGLLLSVSWYGLGVGICSLKKGRSLW